MLSSAFEMGPLEFDGFANDERALLCFSRACSLNPCFSMAWYYAGAAHARLGHYADALRCLQQAESQEAMASLVAEAQGDALYNLGQFDAARIKYRRAIHRSGNSAAVESKLGLAEVRAGLIGAGWKHLSSAVAWQPSFRELYDRLISAALWLGRLEDAARAAVCKLTRVEQRPEDYIRAASILVQLEKCGQAQEILQAGLMQFPNEKRLLECFKESGAEPVAVQAPASTIMSGVF